MAASFVIKLAELKSKISTNKRQATRLVDSPLRLATLKRLVSWYREHRRNLPWRNSSDPYHIWVSEIMLQQTQVETVKPYYARFLKAFPTAKALARADIDDVLKAWEGAGYYARARNLHKSAQQITANGGRLPQSQHELIRLPGVGEYTAAAIASIAFDEPVPVVDGNVKRVLARILCLKTRGPRFESRIRSAAQAIMQSTSSAGLRPGEFNQAMMELGATICRPRIAQCDVCPLRSDCRARRDLADPTALPVRAKTKPLPHFDVTAAIIRKRGRILITKRPDHGLLAGLWEFPGGKKEQGESLEACLEREIMEELGMTIRVNDFCMKVPHAYSHFRITLHAFECEQLGGRIRKLEVADYRWVKPAELSRYAFPKADREILNRLIQS